MSVSIFCSSAPIFGHAAALPLRAGAITMIEIGSNPMTIARTGAGTHRRRNPFAAYSSERGGYF